MKRNLFLALNFAIAIVFLWLIFYSIDFASLQKTLATSNVFLLLLAGALYLLAHVLSALRYSVLLPEYSISTLFSSHIKSMLASDATPGRVGYSLFIFDMRKKGLRGGKGAKVMGISLASDFLVRGLLAFLAVLLFSKDFGPVGLIVILVSLVLFALLFYKISLFARILSKLPFYGKRLKNAYDTVFKQKTSANQLAFSIAFSLLGAMTRGLEWLLVFQALGLNFGIVNAIILSALVTALSFIPLSLSGFGLQEGGGIILLTSLFGFTVVNAASAMLFIRFIDVFVDLIAGGWFFARESNKFKR